MHYIHKAAEDSLCLIASKGCKTNAISLRMIYNHMHGSGKMRSDTCVARLV